MFCVLYRVLVIIPVNKSRRPNVLLMLGQRHKRWNNVKIAVGQRLFFAGILKFRER